MKAPHLLPLFLLASLASAQSQSQPGPTEAPAPHGEEPVVLNPFVVETSSNDGYIAKSAIAAGRVAQQLENVPQRIEVFNADFIKDISAGSFQDILRYSSSVEFNNSERNASGGLVRGFDFAVPLRNGVAISAGLSGTGDLEAIEQVEVVKGPAAVLYGASQPGGVINYVTKRPQFIRGTSVTAGTFSEGGYLASIDHTGPLGWKDRSGREMVAYRFIATREDRGEYQMNDDFYTRDLLFGRVTYEPLRNLSFDLEAERTRLDTAFFNSQTVTRAEAQAFAAGTKTAQQVTLPDSYLPVDWTYQDRDGSHREDNSKFVQASLNYSHDFGRFGTWALRGYYSWLEYSADRVLVDLPSSAYYPQPVTAADIGKTVNYDQTVTQGDVDRGRLWIPGRYVRRIEDRPIDVATTQWDLTGKFATGPVGHTFLIGTDKNLGTKVKAPNGESATREKQAYRGTESTVNAIWVDQPDLRPITNINWNDIRSATNPNGVVSSVFYSGAQANTDIKWEVPFLTAGTTALYFFDAMSFWNERLQVSAGARHDDLKQTVNNVNYTASQWTYRYGAVVKVTPQFHLFALYNESYLPNSQDAAQAYNHYIAPQQGKHQEGGVRFYFWENRLTIEASAFDIKNTNVVQSDPYGNVGVSNPDPRNLFKFVDGVRNQGYDISATLNLTRSTQVLASYSHYDIRNAANPTQVAQGIKEYPVNNVPSDQMSVWGKWTPGFECVRGVSFMAGYRYYGSRPAGGIGSLPSLYLPAYDMVDVGAGYQWQRWNIALMVRNVFNTYAFRTASALNRFNAEKPRNAALTVSTQF